MTIKITTTRKKNTPKIASVGEDLEKLRALVYYCLLECKMVQPLQKKYFGSY